VPAAWVEAATARQTSNGSSPTSDWDQGYGYQFWRSRHGAYRGDGAFGQFCIVLPEQDAVVAITSGVRDMQSVLNLVWDKLLPALASTPLPPDEEAGKKLSEMLEQLTLRMPEGVASPAPVAGKEFVFPDNERKLESIMLDAVGPDGGVTLVIRVNGAEQRIACGRSADDTYTAKFCFVETPFTTTLRLKFSGDELRLSIESNVGIGPTPKVELTGKAE
jgi:hypothetical protein